MNNHIDINPLNNTVNNDSNNDTVTTEIVTGTVSGLVSRDPIQKLVKSDEIFREFGCEINSGKITLKIGTLFLSKGNLTSIKKNISDQLSKRTQSFDLTQINSIKFCVPISGSITKLGIEQSCMDVFVGLSELYIDTKPEYPGKYFVKVIFPKPIETFNIVNLGSLRESNGTVANIKKNIKSQFEKMESKQTSQIQNESTDIIRCMIPIHNEDTKLGIEQFLIEKYLDSKYRVLRLTSGIFMVDIFLS